MNKKKVFLALSAFSAVTLGVLAYVYRETLCEQGGNLKKFAADKFHGFSDDKPADDE